MGGFLDFISNFIEITGNGAVDSVILAVIGIISLSYALGLVDAIFSFFGIYDSGLMSDVHWIIRIIVFIGLSLLCIGIAKLVNFLLSIPWWVYVIVVVLIVGIIILIIVLRHKKSKKKSKEKSEGNNLDNK